MINLDESLLNKLIDMNRHPYSFLVWMITHTFIHLAEIDPIFFFFLDG